MPRKSPKCIAHSEEQSTSVTMRHALCALCACGQAVRKLRVDSSKTRESIHKLRLSTILVHKNASFLLVLNTTFTQLLHHTEAKFSSVISYFYPPSTGPIIKTTKYSY
jgi:hypothetical protein